MEDMSIKPVTVVLFGATGDLSRRKLLPGLLHLFETELIPDLQIIGTSLDEHTEASFVDFVHEAVKEFAGNDGDLAAWPEFVKRLHWRPAPRARLVCAPRSRRPRRRRWASGPGCTTSAFRRRRPWRW